MQTTKQAFAKALFAKTGFAVVNGTGMRKLANGLTVKASIVTTGYSGHYTGIRVEIINALAATADKQFFGFNSFLRKAPGSRADYDSFEVIEHCGWEWYILTPSVASIAEMFEEIDNYIGFFG